MDLRLWRKIYVTASALAVLGSAPIFAGDETIFGEWCHEGSGEMIFIERDALGNMEHSICEWRDVLPENAQTHRGIADCYSAYLLDDGSVKRLNERAVEVDAKLLTEGGLSLDFSDGSGAYTYQNCE